MEKQIVHDQVQDTTEEQIVHDQVQDTTEECKVNCRKNPAVKFWSSLAYPWKFIGKKIGLIATEPNNCGNTEWWADIGIRKGAQSK